jgi:hypothetical protein
MSSRRKLGNSPRLWQKGAKLHLVNRSDLDERTNTYRVFDSLINRVHTDLGGEDQLSAIQLGLVEAFAGASVMLGHLNTQVLAGAEIDSNLVTSFSAVAGAMVRLASRLGVGRIPRTVGASILPPSPEAYFAFKAKADLESTDLESTDLESADETEESVDA